MWYLDSSATSHITNDVSTHNSTIEYRGTSKLFMGNGTYVLVAHVCSSSIVTSNRLLHLKHVIHIPTMCDKS